MTRRIEFEGQVHEFPDDFTDDEIAASLMNTPPVSAPATRQQRQQAAEATAQRALNRNMTPMGVVIQPFVNTLVEPERRQELVRSARGLGRDIASIPSLDFPRLARETGEQVTQGVRDLPQTLGHIAQNLPQVARAATYGPFQDEERAMQRLDLARATGNRTDAEAAAREGNSQAGLAGINVAAPLALAGSPSVLRAGITGAATATPLALSGEGDLQERIPRAVPTIVGAAALSAGTQALANGAHGIFSNPTRAARRVQQMEQAGVDPSIAAANAGTFGGTMSGALTNTIADNPISGLAVRPRIGRQLEQAAAEARRIQGGYGGASTVDGAGQIVQRGLRRYAGDRGAPNPRPGVDPRSIDTSEWSIPAQREAIYDHVLRPVDQNTTILRRTVQAISDLENLADADPAVMRFRPNDVMRDITDTAHNIHTRPNQPLTIRAARELRRRLRLQMDSPGLLGGQDSASLQRVYSALTDDIIEAAGPQAGPALRRADRWYQSRIDRVHNTLASVVNPSDPTAVSASQAFQAIRRAMDARRGNPRMLVALRDSLRPQEMRTLASSVIEDMGTPTNGAGGTQAAELGFSVNTFSTNWRSMSPLARRIVFGKGDLARSLDNLADVVDMLKGVERTTNNSGSGRYANIALTAGGAVANWQTTAAALLAGGITGELLTNPAFVRWLTSAVRAGHQPGGARGLIRGLNEIARRDPAVAAYAAELSQRGPDASGDRAGMRPQLEPALQ